MADTIMLKNPRQASRVFGLDQVSFDGGLTTGGVPRPKFLFLAKFIRGAGQGAAPTWANGMTFALRKMDRPRVTPDLTTLRQYNKKRIVQTGVKYGTVRMEFHDTIDAAVLRMWDEYSKYHFGDFRSANGNEWKYDIANKDFSDFGTGFGLTLPQGNNQNSIDRNAEFFFDKIECYQFFGGTFIQYDLINPRIASFDPDDMDYSDGTATHTISMTIDFESIIYHNSSVPAPIQYAGVYNDLLLEYNGQVYDPPSSVVGSNGGIGGFLDSILGNAAYLGSSILGNKASSAINNALGINSVTSALNSYGAFNFGSVGNQIVGQVLGGAQTNAISGIVSTTSSIASGVSNSVLNSINGNRNSSSQIGVRTDSTAASSSSGLGYDPDDIILI